MMNRNDQLLLRIRKAEEEIRKIVDSPENKRRTAYWDEVGVSADYFHAVPKTKDITTFTVELERPQYAKILGFAFEEYYHNPYLHYLSGLEMQLFKFKHFDDCTPVVKSQAVYPSGAFEYNIFGGDEAIYTEHDAVISHTPIIKEREDLYKMEYPDFYTSGCMPATIAFYEKVREIASADFEIGFPIWGRSSWGCAWQMRRLENLLIDYMEDPEWLDQLLKFLNEARKAWSLQKANYLGVPLSPCNIYNDEVLAPIVSPALYEKYILPREIELSEFYGGCCYWHSCGDTTHLLHLINKIPNTEIITVSAWTDVEKAGLVYSTDKVFEVQLHSLRDVLTPENENTLPDRIRLIKNACKNHRANIQAGGFVFINGYDADMARLNELCKIAKEILF